MRALKSRFLVARRPIINLLAVAFAFLLLLSITPNSATTPQFVSAINNQTNGYGYGGTLVLIPLPPSNWVWDYTTSDGEFTEDVNIGSDDGKVELHIGEGTTGLTEDGGRIYDITIDEMDDPPDPPEESNRIGLTYDFGPDGATFDPPAELTFTYDPDEIPEGVDEEDLVISIWDEETGEWVDLECTVDPETNTITAVISHFTLFSVTAYTSPAAFEVTYLTVQPTEVDVNEDVKIRAEVTNSGDLSGSYNVVLKINGQKVDTERVTLAGGEKDTVSFTVSQDTADAYRVEVNGWSQSFTVVAPPAPPAPTPAPAPAPAPAPPVAPAPAPAVGPNWPLIIGLIGAVVIIGLAIYFIRRGRRVA